jgi:hypothetical protein
MNMKLTFTGHETFHCRPLWLLKGFNFIKDGNRFTDQDAVVKLGVGKNMVTSISYWLKSFNILTLKGELTEFGEFLLGETGRDKYFEIESTYWLLHYHLIKTEFASIYNLFFNDFRKDRSEFSKEQFLMYLNRVVHHNSLNITSSSIEKDIHVMLRNYVISNSSTKNLEDVLSGLFYDLNLIEETSKKIKDSKTWYLVENRERENLPADILLYCILDNPTYGLSINIDELINGKNSPGRIFCLNTKGLIDKLNELTSIHDWIVYSDDAGIRQLQFTNEPDKWKILDEHYASQVSSFN